MELTGTLVEVLPLQTGQGKNGTWKKQNIVVETEGQYPKKVCISIWGDKIDDSQLRTGNKLTISFDIESREYNGRWYTDVKAWKVATANGGTSAPKEQAPMETFSAPPINGEDDLPF